MALIATNHLLFILEFAILVQIGVLLLLNFVDLNLNLVLFISLIASTGLALIFGFDAACLLLPMLNHHEFTHPYGPLAILFVVTSMACVSMYKDAKIRQSNFKLFLIIIIIAITIFGAIVHRDFLIMWVLGLLIGIFIISKSFRRNSRNKGTSFLSMKRILLLAGAIVAVFALMEVLAQVLNMPIISPLSRIDRMNANQFGSLQLVIDNTNLMGHNPNATYWNESLGNSDGYISLPLTFITYFSLPFPLFYGILVTKKDVIDYFLPGIFGVGFDFGYLVLALVIIWLIIVMVVGFKALDKYRLQRERGNKKFRGREALLIGSLSAFIAQTILGFFVITRTINGSALVTYIFLSALVMAHVVTTKR